MDTNKWIKEVIDNCYDIMIELQDVGMSVKVKRSLFMEDTNSVEVRCTMISDFKLYRLKKNEIKEVLDRLNRYMISEGFEEIERSKSISPLGEISISFKKSNLNNDYIGHLRYLKKYNLYDK